MFQFTVQAAKHSDADAICKISKSVLNSDIPPDELKKLYVEIIEDIEQIILTAVNSGHTVGFIHAKRVKDLVLGVYTEIVTVALLPYYQKRGGGTSLVLGVEQWSRQMLTHDIRCRSDNVVVKQLLKGCGYTQNGNEIFEKTII